MKGAAAIESGIEGVGPDDPSANKGPSKGPELASVRISARSPGRRRHEISSPGMASIASSQPFPSRTLRRSAPR